MSDQFETLNSKHHGFITSKLCCKFHTNKEAQRSKIRSRLQITKLRETQTQFGKRIIADNEFAVFLPARILKSLKEDENLYNQMKKAAEDRLLALKYIGGKSNKIEFKNIYKYCNN